MVLGGSMVSCWYTLVWVLQALGQAPWVTWGRSSWTLSALACAARRRPRPCTPTSTTSVAAARVREFRSAKLVLGEVGCSWGVQRQPPHQKHREPLQRQDVFGAGSGEILQLQAQYSPKKKVSFLGSENLCLKSVHTTKMHFYPIHYWFFMVPPWPLVCHPRP